MATGSGSGQAGQGGQGLAFWRARLGQAPLPLLSTPEALEEMLSASVSLQRMAALLQSDPVLTVDLVLAAARLPAVAGEVAGVQHALNLLGLNRVQALIRARSVRLLREDSAAHRGFAQAVVTSHFAASLVLGWSDPRQPGEAESLACMTLLLGLARWKLPLADLATHQRIEARVAQGERRGRVEADALGCDPGELARALLLDAGLPEQGTLLGVIQPDRTMLARGARKAWTGALAEELSPELGRWLYQRTVPCVLAHLVAWAGCDAWYSPRSRFLQRVLSARGRKPLNEVVAALHQQAVRASRAMPQLAGWVLAPGTRLFWAPLPPRSLRPVRRADVREASGQHVPRTSPGGERSPVPPVRQTAARPASGQGPRLVPVSNGVRPDTAQATGSTVVSPAPRPAVGAADRPAPARQPEPSPRPEPARKVSPAPDGAAAAETSARSVAQKPDPARIQAFVARCRDDAFADMGELLREVGDVLDRGLLLRRSLIFLRAVRASELSCYHKHGLPVSVLVSTLKWPDRPDSPLGRVLHEAGHQHVPAAELAVQQAGLPERLQALVQPAGYSLCAISVKNKGLGLVWADCGVPPREVHPRQHEAFRALVGHFSQAFVRVAARRRPASG